MHLSGLFVDADPRKIDREDFSIRDDARDEPIYEFLYLDGSISGGKLTGKWIAPPASPTNAALLWRGALEYFLKSIRHRSPEIQQ